MRYWFLRIVAFVSLGLGGLIFWTIGSGRVHVSHDGLFPWVLAFVAAIYLIGQGFTILLDEIPFERRCDKIREAERRGIVEGVRIEEGE